MTVEELSRPSTVHHFQTRSPFLADRCWLLNFRLRSARWLFDEGGKPCHDNLVDYRWRTTRIDGGLNFKLHDLQHYFANGLIPSGCDVVAVQRAMGHSSATTTLNTYAHLWPSAEDKARAAASGIAVAVLATDLSDTQGR